MRNLWRRVALSLFCGGVSILGGFPAAAKAAAPSPEPQLVLVKNGNALAPIVIFKDAPPLTRQAADELAYYIEKISGAKPEVIEGEPDPTPEHAIWVGYQPALDHLFPDINFEFEQPEEILLAANDKHLVIAGRDRWDPDHLVVPIRFNRTFDGFQQEYGTHNAVYTFLHDQLDVRWLWPGELGDDIPNRATLAFDPFVYRYHPQVRARSGLLPWHMFKTTGRNDPIERRSGYWYRAQRLQLCELPSMGGHGPWGGWWKRFHKTNPEYFALQPDGTRGGGENPFPSEGNVKMCQSNPDLARQWLADVEESLEQNPNQRVFNVSPGDGYHSGHCICENCRAWDHPDAEPRMLHWSGVTQKYLALSDRDITFANRCARLLKERFPDKDLYVYMLAYGHSVPPPVAAVPDDHVIIGDVANFLFKSNSPDPNSEVGGTREGYFAGWGKLTKNHFWRPNVGAPVGFQWGLPDVPLRRTMADMKFAASNGWMGIYVDFNRDCWATQGPLNYLMAQLVWNPYAEGEAILKDYYQRAFGPAAREMEFYWNYMETLREECYGTEHPDRADQDILDFYNSERLNRAYRLLDAARAQLGPDDERYRQRIAFVAAGLDFTRLITDCGRLTRLVQGYEDPDGQALAKLHANWDQLRALCKQQPDAVRWRLFFRGGKADGEPQTPRYAPPLWVETAPPARGGEEAGAPVELASGEWEQVFSDEFDREELGGAWTVVEGDWTIADGNLRGSGILISSRGFPGGFQRMEFEAITDVKPTALAPGMPSTVSVGDISSLLHARPPAEASPLGSGYFFQFGGFNNTRNKLIKSGNVLEEKREDTLLITPGKWHKVFVENDAGTLRLIVDGEVVLDHAERGRPLLKDRHDRVGFYGWTAYKVRKVKVFVKRTVEREKDD